MMWCAIWFSQQLQTNFPIHVSYNWRFVFLHHWLWNLRHVSWTLFNIYFKNVHLCCVNWWSVLFINTQASQPDTEEEAPVPDPAADKLKRRNALKAKLRRQCEEKRNGKLLVPRWLHDMWKNGNKDDLAATFEKCNFNTDTKQQLDVCFWWFHSSHLKIYISKIYINRYAARSPSI